MFPLNKGQTCSRYENRNGCLNLLSIKVPTGGLVHHCFKFNGAEELFSESMPAPGVLIQENSFILVNNNCS